MGFIRGVLLVFVCSVLFILLFVGNILLTLSLSLKYENVKPGLVSFLSDVVNEQLNIEEQLNQLFPAIEMYCQTNQEYTFAYGGYTFTIPCDVATQGSSTLVGYGVNSLVDKYYYAEYNCNFWDCFSEGDVPLFLISEKAQVYWQAKFYFALLLSVALAALVFLLVEKKTNFFFLVGGLTILSSLPLIKLDKIAFLFPDSSEGVGNYFSKIIVIFFNQSQSVFIKAVIIGSVFVIIGIILKVFHAGFIISNFFSRIKSNKKIEEEKPIKNVKQVKSIKTNKQLRPIKNIKQANLGKNVKKVNLNKGMIIEKKKNKKSK